MNIKGKLIEKFDTQQVSEKFKKREFAVEYVESRPEYPEFIKFELAQEKVNLIDSFNVGDMIDVSFNLRGRAWTNPQGVKNYFNSLQAWRIVADNGQQIASQQQTQQQAPQYRQAPETSSPSLAPATQDDDLPF